MGGRIRDGGQGGEEDKTVQGKEDRGMWEGG